MDPVFYRIFGVSPLQTEMRDLFMLNALWAGMMAAGIFWAAFHGNMGEVTNGLLDSAKEAVTLGVTMLGIMSFWCGILKIGERAGLIEALTKKMRPVIRFLFPNLPDGHPAGQYIATNMIANMLGLGWAATPAGLKAMEELGTDTGNTIFVGDQIFTDIYGAKRAGIRSILVKPIHPKEEIQIVLKRYLEKIVLYFYRRDLEKNKEKQ